MNFVWRIAVDRISGKHELYYRGQKVHRKRTISHRIVEYSREHHTCDECDKEIYPGDRYERYVIAVHLIVGGRKRKTIVTIKRHDPECIPEPPDDEDEDEKDERESMEEELDQEWDMAA